MVFRRAAYLALFPAAVVLPLWLFIARGVQSTSAGEFLAYALISAALFVGMVATTVLVVLRKRNRQVRATSWADAAVLTALALAIVAAGIWSSPLLAVAVAVLTLGGFWLAVYELVTETRRRLRAFMDSSEPLFKPVPGPGDVYVIRPSQQH